MSEYSFRLVLDGNVERRLNQLFEAGCNDATFGRVDDRQYAKFDREAPSPADAVSSAIRAVESVAGLRVLRVEPAGLVTAEEIARRLRRSCESVIALVGVSGS